MDPFENIVNLELKEAISEALKDIRPRDAMMIRMKFGLEGEDPHSLKEIAEKINRSRTVPFSKINRGLRYLRHPSRSWKIKELTGS
jgi:RNA polymerase primary sigma factor